MKVDPVGMLYAGYVTQPSNKGIMFPIGSCICFDVKQQIMLTASHVLANVPTEIPSGIVELVEIKPEYRQPLVGIHSLHNGRWEIFCVKDFVEILPEITALYIEPESIDGTPFPDELAYPVTKRPIHPLLPVYLIGYPGIIQQFELKPDEEYMEISGVNSSRFQYSVSGIVASCYDKKCPQFIDTELLPAFTVDNGVLPGMSGGLVLTASQFDHEVIGMIVKNIVVAPLIEEVRDENRDKNEKKSNDSPERRSYSIVHTLAVALGDIQL